MSWALNVKGEKDRWSPDTSSTPARSMRREQPSKVWKEVILKATTEFKAGDLQDQKKLHSQTARYLPDL
jgi:hypothetical protein